MVVMTAKLVVVAKSLAKLAIYSQWDVCCIMYELDIIHLVMSIEDKETFKIARNLTHSTS